MSAGSVIAQSADEKAVAEAVEKFRKTMVDPDQATFEELTSAALTYGHSNGLVEDQKTCIASMVTGKYNFNSLELTEQTIRIVDKTAIVRHTFFAHTHDAGKEPGTVKLKVLMVWQKENGKWVLLARQAVRI
ncbi:nuclear transport factor 2 family protein [Dyadobacter helix]|nr:nuclear transport factor 2 family protein [Dyadobacter sp. CECT 9275]